MPHPSTACLAFAALIAIPVNVANATTCADTSPRYRPDPESRLAEYDVVARGTVIRVRTPYRWDGQAWQPPGLLGQRWLEWSDNAMTIVVEVDEVWKGVDSDRLIVHDLMLDRCCGMRWFPVGAEVLVYAGEANGELFVDGSCVPMLSIAEAEADLAWLGPGQRIPHRKELLSRPLTATVLGLLVLVLGGLVWRRRRTSED